MEAIRSSETSVYTISTRRHIPEDRILHVNNGGKDKWFGIKCHENWPSFQDKHVYVGSDVFMTVTASLVFVYRRFGGTLVHLCHTTRFQIPEYYIL
jgi:hypothetical protein